MTNATRAVADNGRIAALPMYDFPELRADTDTLWDRLAAGLVAKGVSNVPPRIGPVAQPFRALATPAPAAGDRAANIR